MCAMQDIFIFCKYFFHIYEFCLLIIICLMLLNYTVYALCAQYANFKLLFSVMCIQERALMIS